MINTNDIGKTFKTPAGRVGELRAISTHAGKQYACLHDALTVNPAAIPGINFFWIEADRLVPTCVEV